MKTLSDEEQAKTLAHNGWSLLRINGSHNIYGKKGNTVRLSVPVHGNKPLKKGLQNHLLKSAGLDETDLEE